MRNKLAQKIEPLRCQFVGKDRHPSDISTRSVEARDKTEPNRIIAAHDDDWNCTGRRLGRSDRRTIRENDRYPTIYQVGGKCWQAIVPIVGPAIFDCNVVTLNIAGLLQALPEGRRHRRVPISRCAVKKPDHRQGRLLCMTHQRPRNRRSANKTEKLPPPHDPPQALEGGIVTVKTRTLEGTGVPSTHLAGWWRQCPSRSGRIEA